MLIVVLLTLYQAKRIWDQSNLYESVKAELATCQTSIKETKVLNGKLQSDRDDVASKLAIYKRMRPNSCLQLANTQQIGAGHAGTHGIETDWLREYAAQCEIYRRERIALEHALAGH